MPTEVLAWTAAAACTACSGAGLALQWVTRSVDFEVSFGSRPSTNATAFAFMVLPAIGAVVAVRRADSPIGWLFIGVGATMAVWVVADGLALYTLLHRPDAVDGGRWFAWLADWIWIPGWGLTGVIFLLFPTGTLPTRRWRAVVVALLATTVAFTATAATTRGRLANYSMVTNPVGIGARWSAETVKTVGLLALAGVGLPTLASLVVRRRSAAGDERQQVDWLFWSASVLVGLVATFAVLRALGGRVAWAESWVLTAGIIVPLAAGVALLKFHLYGIDLVVNRTILFGCLGAFITAVYAVVVVGVGDLLDLPRARNPGLSIIATAIVAVTFDPARSRAQRLANRVVYGERATPYEALSRFSERMSGEFAGEDVLTRMAEVIAEGTGARRAEVWLRVDRTLRRAARWPAGDVAEDAPIAAPRDDELPALPGGGHRFPVCHEGELLGAISVSVASEDRLTPAQQGLLVHLASQAALVLRNVRLITELRASRQRIVTAGDAERRRLERDIHDGAQQQLVAMAMKLRLAGDVMSDDPAGALALIDELRGEALEALANLRDLARGIYPPLLADAGLVAALRSSAAKSPVPTDVEATGVGRYDQDVEAATYFCCLEAMQNVAKYADASNVVIRLEGGEDHLSFSVTDDGHGFDPSVARGSGTVNMADRLEALGGALHVRSSPGEGTTVTGRLPARTPEPNAVGARGGAADADAPVPGATGDEARGPTPRPGA